MIDKKGKDIVGYTKVPLQKEPCSMRECNLGNFVADALVHYYVSELSGKETGAWTEPIIGLVPTGSIRTTLKPGRKSFIYRNSYSRSYKSIEVFSSNFLAISYNDLATTVPFENSIDTFQLRGDHLKDLFEYAVKGSWQSTVFDGQFFIQVSGKIITFDFIYLVTILKCKFI